MPIEPAPAPLTEAPMENRLSHPASNELSNKGAIKRNMVVETGVLSLPIRFASDVVLLVLFLRYVLYGYETYAVEPFFRFLYRMTENLCHPLRILLPYRLRVRRDYTPILAMGVVLLARGIFFALDDFFGGGLAGLGTLISKGLLQSAAQFVRSGYLVLVTLLFIAAALHQSREFYYSNFFLRVWVSKTEGLFDAAKKLARSDNYWFLYLVILIILALAAGALNSLIAWNRLLWIAWANTAVSGLGRTLNIYAIAVFVYVLLSWLRPEGGNPLIQVITAIAQPSVRWARRMFPWAQIGMFDLSVIALFVGIVLAEMVLLQFQQQIFVGTPVPPP
jgi:uncharacterized protein YggT (Ycf19 family)